MKKRLLALLLALAMTLAMTACGGQKDTQENDTQQVEDATPPAEENGGAGDAGEVEDATTDDPQEVPDEEAAETQKGDGSTGTVEKPVEQPAEKPSEPVKPVGKPTEKPTTPAKPVEKPAASTVDLAAFYESLAGSQTDWPAMMALEGESLGTFYAGLGDIATKQCGVYTAMMSAAVGEIALVEVENAGDVQKVKDIFQARIDYQVGDDQNPGGAWYPASIESWKNDSRIVSNGNCVMLIAFQGADSVVESFNALFA